MSRQAVIITETEHLHKLEHILVSNPIAQLLKTDLIATPVIKATHSILGNVSTSPTRISRYHFLHSRDGSSPIIFIEEEVFTCSDTLRWSIIESLRWANQWFQNEDVRRYSHQVGNICSKFKCKKTSDAIKEMLNEPLVTIFADWTKDQLKTCCLDNKETPFEAFTAGVKETFKQCVNGHVNTATGLILLFPILYRYRHYIENNPDEEQKVIRKAKMLVQAIKGCIRKYCTPSICWWYEKMLTGKPSPAFLQATDLFLHLLHIPP